MYLNSAAVASLPAKCSRHNAPSRAHAITKLVKAFSTGQSDSIVVVCDRADVYASGCAVARAFSKYSLKTKSGAPRPVSSAVINVEFLLTNDDVVSQEELDALNYAAEGIQTAAMIVDTPCSDMHTDAFIEVYYQLVHTLAQVETVVFGFRLSARLARKPSLP